MADSPAPGTTIYLCRHGDTEWSPTRRLAGRTDLPLSGSGEDNARRLAPRLAAVGFDRVLVSPLRRARRTAELAGFAEVAVVDERLSEMNFGRYEGGVVAEIRRERPGWTYLRDGCPDGEGPDDVGRRVDALLAELRAAGGTSLLFAHSVVLRVLAARFLGFPPGHGRHLMMGPASLGVLTFDPMEDAPVISSWNEPPALHG